MLFMSKTKLNFPRQGLKLENFIAEKTYLERSH